MTWEELEKTCTGCTKCELSKTRQNVVFGVGKSNADIMFIGEAPGRVEDETGEPFTGAAGKLLDDMLLIIGLNRSKVYIANILKCRPPQNRDPNPSEQDACMGYLENQIELVSPKLIVCLGRISACRLIRKDYKITKEHGIIEKFENIHITAIYHPAALLRDEKKLPDTFDDLKKIEAFVNENNIKI